MRRAFRYRFVALAALTAATATVSFLAVRRTLSAQSRVAFSATATHSIYKRSGEAALKEELVQATRSDGSTASVRRIIVPAIYGATEQKRIVDLSRAEEVSVDGFTDSLLTYPLPRVGVEYLRRKPSSCTTDDAAQRVSMLGYEVVRAVRDLPAGEKYLERIEEWRAPALDCFPLKSTTVRGPSEADLYVSSVTEVSQVTVGEPAPSFFETPPGYVERSPSQRSQARSPEGSGRPW